jgi:tetratricopeptide (TPR) repeat protein
METPVERGMPNPRNAELIDFNRVAIKQRGRVSCCMLAADEEPRIGRSIASVRDLVDEVIVVDTGSGDGTGEAARSAGARVIHVPWHGDFSEARNAALIRATGEWILVLDADEVIAGSDHDRIRALTSEAADRAFRFEQRTYCNEPTTFAMQPLPYASEMSRGAGGFFTCRQVRLFRKCEGARYHGRVFEEIESSLNANGVSVIDADIVIHHYGRLEPAERVYRKALTCLHSESERCTVHRHNVPFVFEIAVQLFALGNAEEARDLVTQCLEIAPGSWQFLNLRGLIDLESGRKCDAIDSFQRAIDINGDAYELYHNLGAALMENGAPGPALLNFELGIAIAGDDARLLEKTAVAALATGKIEEARGYIDRALAGDPHRPNAHVVRAEILSALGDVPGAVCALRSLRFIPDVPLKVYLRSLQLCTRMNVIDEAERILETAMKEHPESTGLLFVRGKILELGGEDDKALAVYKRLLAVDPGNIGVLMSLGCLLERTGERARALEVLYEACRLSPHDHRIEVNLAIVLEKLGRGDEAERILRGVVNERCELGTAFNALGCLLANRGMYGESIPYFERAIALEPSNTQYRLNLDLANRRLFESAVLF